MLSDEQLTEIMDRAAKIMENSRAGRTADRSTYMMSPVFDSLVGFLIVQEAQSRTAQTLKG